MAAIIDPDLGIVILDEITATADNSPQTLDFIPQGDVGASFLSQLYIGIYSINTCESPENTSVPITVRLCDNDGSGFAQRFDETIVFNKTLLDEFKADPSQILDDGFSGGSARPDVMKVVRNHIDKAGWIKFECTVPGVRLMIFHSRMPVQ